MRNIRNGNSYFQAKNIEKILPVLKKMEKLTPRKAIAAHLDMPYKTWSRVVSGELHLPIEKVPLLAELPGGDEILTILLEPIGKIAIQKVEAVRPVGSGVTAFYKTAHKLPQSVGDAFRVIEESLKDGILDMQEYRVFHAIINRLQQFAAEMDALFLKSVSRGRG